MPNKLIHQSKFSSYAKPKLDEQFKGKALLGLILLPLFFLFDGLNLRKRSPSLLLQDFDVNFELLWEKY